MQPAVLLLGRAGEREDLGIARVRSGVAEGHRRDRRGAEDLVHQTQAQLAHALTAELGWKVGCPQALRLDLLLQRRHRLAQPVEAELAPDRLQRPDLAADDLVHPVELLLEVRVGAEVPTHEAASFRSGADGSVDYKPTSWPRSEPRGSSALISATGTARSAERRTVAIQRPGCTAARGELVWGASSSTVRSRSETVRASPHKRAGRSGPPPRVTASSGSWTTSRISAPRRK